MRNMPCLVLWILSHTIVLGQQSLSDSLKNLLTQPIPDTNKILILDQLGRNLMYSQPVEALKYAQEGLGLANQINYEKGQARMWNRVGTILRISGSYTKALEAHLKSIRIAEKNQDLDGLARTYNNVGILYSEQKNHHKAIEFYHKTESLAKKLGDDNLKRISLSNLGMDYAFLNRLDSALYFTQAAYQMALQQKGGYTNVVLGNMGNIYKRMGQYQRALDYYKQGIPKSVSIENNRALSQIYLEMAEVFQKLIRSDSAIVYGQKALQLAQQANIIPTVMEASNLLASIYEPTNKARAFDYLKIAMVAKDSIQSAEKIKNFQKVEFNEQIKQQEIRQAEQDYQSRIRTYIMVGAMGIFLLVSLLLYRNNRLKQKANILLKHQRDEINLQRDKAEKALTELRATQAQLIQSEKLASLGELTAGIAHEIQNPLNFVNNFSEMSVELANELQEVLRQRGIEATSEEGELVADLIQNQEKINHHGMRASSIVKGMLEHSRTGTGVKELTDINKLADEYLRLSYHGLRAKDKSFNSDYTTEFDENLPKINVIPQDIGRVLLNLINNAFYAVYQKSKIAENYRPSIFLTTQSIDNQIMIKVRDNGDGIPRDILPKIFQPFFTTKPTGEGTGLGLSLSYDIVTKGHGGTIEVESKEGEGTTFIVKISKA